MDRRGFLKMLGMGAAVATVAPTYFFAPSNGWTATEAGLIVPSGNAFLDVSWVTAKTLEILLKNLSFTEVFNRDWDEKFTPHKMPANRVEIRMPQRFHVGESAWN